MTKDNKKDDFAKLPTMQEIKNFFTSLKAFLFATSLEKSGYFLKVKKDLEKNVGKPVKFAFVVIAITFGFFVVWGGLAPLDSAITAPGSITPNGNKKIIQHESGGVIKAILVKDGDHVKENQPLIELSATQAQASFQIVLSQLRTAATTEARLLAEESGVTKIDFTSEYLAPSDPIVQRLMKNQEQIFEARTALIKGRLDGTEKKIEQYTERIKGETGQLKSTQSQLVTARQNVKDAEALLKTGAVAKTYLSDQRSRLEQLEGQEAQLISQIATLEQVINEQKIDALNIQNDYKNKIEEEYRQNHVMLLEAEQKYSSIKETLDRTIIKAPIAGIVTALKWHTVGGFINPGAPIMEIIPQDDDLIIEAFAPTNDIHSLHVGMPAKIQLDPYKQRLVPRISGEVTYVSADKMMNPNAPGQEFFHVKVKIDKEMLKNLNSEVHLYPGMPVTVFMIRGTSTFLQYLLSPIVDSLHKAFKEQ